MTNTQTPTLADIAHANAQEAFRVANEAQPQVTKAAADAVAAAAALVDGDSTHALAAQQGADAAAEALRNVANALIDAIASADDAFDAES